MAVPLAYYLTIYSPVIVNYMARHPADVVSWGRFIGDLTVDAGERADELALGISEALAYTETDLQNLVDLFKRLEAVQVSELCDPAVPTPGKMEYIIHGKTYEVDIYNPQSILETVTDVFKRLDLPDIEGQLEKQA